jgi:amidohydrolase
MDFKSRVIELSEKYFSDIVQIRRLIHANPELSFEEFDTAKLVIQELQKMGLEATNIANTGVMAMIRGKNPDSKTVALRADLDALPIEEANDVEYKSQKKGVMHACGHDVHTASLLGTARILNELKEHFEGSVKLIFQPGEEKYPGGASLMIKEGALENPRPANIMGQHVMTMIPTGKVGFREGMFMASADEIFMVVKGKGGHGAMPEMNVDPVLIASHIIVALQQIVSRHASPKVPSVLSFGKFIANGATNVIPDEVYIEGTFRTLDEEWRMEAHKKIKKMAEGMAESMGGKCEIDIMVGYPYLENTPELTRRAKNYAIEFLGEENVMDLDIWMAAEDFAFYTKVIDSCFYRLGVRNEAMGITSSVHTPTFNVDEQSLKIGSGLMAWIALNELGSVNT